MDFYFVQTALEVIEFRSFSNLWFWIALAVLWSSASHWLVGVPFDMIQRARRGHEMSLSDMHLLANVQSRRLIFVTEATGHIITALAFFVMSSLALLGFLYGIEFAQAVLLLFAPMMVVAWLSLRTAKRVAGMDAPKLADTLAFHRRQIQFVGIISIFGTSMWGMWTNLNHSVLGG